jgi:4-hydroxy-tetrahydrodipicolinate reductase
MSKELIRLRDLCMAFDDELVLDNINLYINDSEFLTLLGPSGCGKTTTLRIIGHGKMGREIEKILLERGHRIGAVIDEANASELDAAHLAGIDVALEFTTPDAAYGNIRACIDAGIPVVSGTTGWTNRLEELRSYCREKGGALFYASNYCLGVNLMFRLNRRLARMMERFDAYDVRIEEIHHTQKKDAPSGTAITLAEGIISEIGRKTGWVNEPSDDLSQIVVTSLREGAVPGTHTVTYESDDDRIELKHTIKNRRTLALGAVVAAEFLCGKKGVYTMDDLLK